MYLTKIGRTLGLAAVLLAGCGVKNPARDQVTETRPIPTATQGAGSKPKDDISTPAATPKTEQASAQEKEERRRIEEEREKKSNEQSEIARRNFLQKCVEKNDSLTQEAKDFLTKLASKVGCSVLRHADYDLKDVLALGRNEAYDPFTLRDIFSVAEDPGNDVIELLVGQIELPVDQQVTLERKKEQAGSYSRLGDYPYTSAWPFLLDMQDQSYTVYLGSQLHQLKKDRITRKRSD